MKQMIWAAGLALLALAPDAAAKDRITHNAEAVNTETILHVWSWNFPSMARDMKKIADAGFTMIQTSPVQACYSPEGGNVKLFDEKEGNWYHYYQPVDWTIGNNIVGDKEQMKEMLDSAKKYNIRVIVDVLPNHTAFDTDAVTSGFYKAVGGKKKMFHTDGLKEITDYNDRYQCTLQGTGGLPDVNTENPKFQKYYMQFVNELINMGVGGFRYDTAKHIGVHSDPVDKKAGVRKNDFWDVATGRKAVNGVRLAADYDSLFVYGEILQDRNVPEKEYADYMGQTASSYGHVLRSALENRSAKGLDLKSWHHGAAPEYLTSWVESHDTYCNAHESASLTDTQIRMGWVFLTARQNGTPLFFNRPANSTIDNVWGDNLSGACGKDDYVHPEVVAVNNFRKAMTGQTETIEYSEGGELILVNRGNAGAALVNLEMEPGLVALPTTLADGIYYDAVHKTPFIVKGGVLNGVADAETAYIIYAKRR